MMLDNHGDERLMQLLADGATEGLDSTQMAEVRELLAAHPGVDGEALERAAALLDVALLGDSDEPLPADVRQRLLEEARTFFARGSQASGAAPRAIPFKKPASSSRTSWYLTAASLLLAALGWWQVLNVQPHVPQPLSEQYAQFSQQNTDAVQLAWSGQVPGYQSVDGDVVWSDDAQGGFMHFIGLKPNKPSEAQYQLWIIDPDRDANPVDGGVFDVPPGKESFVAIDAKLRVDQPATFAITLEQPGGVVVSEGPLLVVATKS